MISKRKHRRNRYKIKNALQILDELALKQIDKDYNLSAASWGGSRCPGCGKNVRPASLVDAKWIIEYVDGGRMWGIYNACDSEYIRIKCPGEKAWN
jgi:hypothetical protein